jgi:AcrR family transcriptional regulator
VYGGLTADERRKRRRNQLIEAGIELFGTRGYQGTSIRAVVRESGLIERYFYESFDSLDDLFGAVYERVRRQVFEEVMTAIAEAGDDHEEQLRAGVRTFIVSVTRDPRWARIKLIEEAGIKYRIACREGGGPDSMVDYIVATAPPSDEFDPRLLAVGLVGAVTEILSRWYHGELEGVTLDDLVEQCTALFVGVERMFLGARV